VFDGDGFGLGLTVVAVDEPPLPSARGERRARWDEVLPPESRSRAGQANELSRLQAEKARMFAYEARLVCEFADTCEAGEFFVDELAAALGTSVTAASYAWIQSQILHRQLPGTWAALADGELDVPRARGIVAEVGRSGGVDPAVLRAVEASVLPRALELTVTSLRAAVRAELIAHDAAFAERRRAQAERNADVAVRPDPGAPGRADLVVGMSTEDAHACWAMADEITRAARAAGDDRPLGVLRVEAVRNRILGPEGETPPFSAQVTVLAPLDALENAEPVDGRSPVAQVAGQPVTATHLRELLERLDALCPGGLQAPTGGLLRIAVTDSDGTLRGVLTPRELRGMARRGCPDHPPGTDCGCGLLDRPPAVDRYRPSAAQYEFIWTRDRRCRMPGRTARTAWADLDHVLAHACGGATDCSNLCCLCRRHHRLKTHERGWTFRLRPDATLEVTSPSGITRVTRPPGVRVPAPAGGAAPPARAPDDDPPPF